LYIQVVSWLASVLPEDVVVNISLCPAKIEPYNGTASVTGTVAEEGVVREGYVA
jgi:hypothetical protein